MPNEDTQEDAMIEVFAVFQGPRLTHPVALFRSFDDAVALQDSAYPVIGRVFPVQVPHSTFFRADLHRERVEPRD